jgi:protein required for attachment to host cells
MTDVRIPAGALVLVGDGSKALFLRNQGSAAEPQLITEQVMAHENPPTREQGTDRPGRYRDSGPGGQRSGMEETDWHQLEEDRFAAEVADALYKAAHAGRYEHLVVVAPPATLGELRKHWHPEVADKLVAEIPKTLTNLPVPDIQKLIAANG